MNSVTSSVWSLTSSTRSGSLLNSDASFDVCVVGGDSGMGMTHGTLGARLVADLVVGRSNELAPVYSPSRLMPGAIRTLIGENLNMAAQFVAWFTGGDVKSADEIPPGQGAVVRSGLTKLAVHKDDDGTVTTLSAVCPHMGCIVRWNPGESTWDCPCHGSRFSAIGTCLHGPSTSNLIKSG
jgi:nitrite reductase/ring-hydroxylating ferredoxin subunit